MVSTRWFSGSSTRAKIVLYAAIIAAAALIFGFYQMGEQRKTAKAQEMFSQAKTEQQFRGYPDLSQLR